MLETLELARGNYLRPNGHGGYLIRQSDLSAWDRCQLQKYYYDRARHDPAAPQPEGLSATIYGTVVHYALQVMEQAMHEGREDALQLGLGTFEHYWANPAELGERITQWLPRQTFGGLRERGRLTLRDHHKLLGTDESWLLALEYQFAVPMVIDGRTHTLTGTIDRLAIKKYNRKPYLSIDDNKGLALDTPLPTPEGWTTMGDVEVGDEVIGSDGHPVLVTLKSDVHHRPCYRIVFDDGSSVITDNVHLWTVLSGRAGSSMRETLSTQLMYARHCAGDTFRVANASPLRMPPDDLPIDPYLLGLWLGDGATSRGSITSADPEVFLDLEKRGFVLGLNQESATARCETRTVKGLQTKLVDLGLLGNKHVPSRYLRASWQQRLDLLRGLMDSDGCWNRGRRHAIFTNTNEQLIDAVHELVVSMGWKARKRQIEAQGFGRTIDSFVVTFTPVDHNPFLLTRKADLVDTLATSMSERARRRMITAIEPVDTVPTQCIRVDAPNSLYLCGEQMVPTHNTGKQPTYLRYNMQGSVYAWASTTMEFWLGWPESGMGDLATFDPETIDRIGRSFNSWGYSLYDDGWTDLPLAARRFRWINLQDIKFADGGWRTERDYARAMLAVDAYVRSCESEIYSVNTTGEVCRYCPFRTTCGGIGLPDEDEGRP